MTSRTVRLLAAALLLLMAALPARAADFAALVSGLPGEGCTAKRKTVAALGALGDARAVAVLKALSGDRLRSTTQGRVLVVGTAPDGGTLLSDAITGKPVTGVDPDSLDR